jgi:aminopeptidase N
VTVPKGLTAIANGVLVDTATADGRTTYRWSQPQPMSTYLAFVTTGVFQVSTGTTRPASPT